MGKERRGREGVARRQCGPIRYLGEDNERKREIAMSNVTPCQVLGVSKVSHGVLILWGCVEFLTRKEARSSQSLWGGLREVQNEGAQV